MIEKKNEMMEKIVCLNLLYCSYYMLLKIKKKENNKVGQKVSKSKIINAFIFYIFTHFLSNLEILKFIGQEKITNLVFHHFHVLPTKLPKQYFLKKKNIYQTIKENALIIHLKKNFMKKSNSYFDNIFHFL